MPVNTNQGVDFANPQRFEWVYRVYMPRLVFYARQFVHNRLVAEDLVQDCFLNWWKNRVVLRSELALRQFLYVSVHHACINYLKQQTRSARRLPLMPPLQEEPVEALLIRAEMLALLSRQVAALPPKTRQVFALYFLKSNTLPEIAAQLKKSRGTIRVQKARAIALLRLALRSIRLE